MAVRRRKPAEQEVKTAFRGAKPPTGDAADRLFQAAPAQADAVRRGLAQMPELSGPIAAIRESVYTLPDPSGTYQRLEAGLSLGGALTPGALQAALNSAEAHARDAHQLYVVAKADAEAFERECDAVVDAMREAATAQLQGEKDRKERSKAITDADVRGRAAVLYPDEWRAINQRQIRTAGTVEHLRVLATLWQTRCYSLAAMLNAGKRS